MAKKLAQKKSILSKWFGNRMPIADEVVLQQRSTYILPTKAGFFMLAVIILMMIGATNYQNNLAFLLTFLIASIGLVSILFTFKNLQGLIFNKGFVESVCVGESLIVKMHVSSQSNQNHMTIGVGFDEQSLFYNDIDASQGGEFCLPFVPEQRGFVKLPRIMATSSFPFGLLKVWTWFQFATPILIYPKPIQPPVDSGIGAIDEETGSQKVAGVDDLYGVKMYQQGDPISRIDWKALAREKGLFTKEFVAYQSQDLVFCWDDFTLANDELKLSFLCYLVIEACKNNYEFGLKIPNAQFAKNSGEKHKLACLKALACYGAEHSI